jgi:hypothetical protein
VTIMVRPQIGSTTSPSGGNVMPSMVQICTKPVPVVEFSNFDARELQSAVMAVGRQVRLGGAEGP